MSAECRHEVDELTWYHFERLYGLTQADEEVFEIRFKAMVHKYGPRFLMQSTLIEHLASVDRGFVSEF